MEILMMENRIYAAELHTEEIIKRAKKLNIKVTNAAGRFHSQKKRINNNVFECDSGVKLSYRYCK